MLVLSIILWPLSIMIPFTSNNSNVTLVPGLVLVHVQSILLQKYLPFYLSSNQSSHSLLSNVLHLYVFEGKNLFLHIGL